MLKFDGVVARKASPSEVCIINKEPILNNNGYRFTTQDGSKVWVCEPCMKVFHSLDVFVAAKNLEVA